jgi:hypothetical protein
MSRTWRLPALILIPLMVVAGLAIQARNDDAAVTDVRLSELTATAAAPGTPSSTWYCAAGSATGVASGEGAGPAEQRVIVANNSDEAARGTMTIFPEGAPPKGVAIEVAAHSRAAVVVSEQVKAPWAAALVEITGGEVTVAHELSGPTGRSVSNCASTPSADWYFPGGTTRVGTDMWIALFNPFPGEATVDIAFETEVGARTAQEYQGIVVPGGSVVVKKVSEKVTLHDHASATVTTRSGRIIAEQVQSFEGREGGAKGLTATVGATTPAPIWAFPMGAPGGVTAGEAVSVFNPGDSDTDVLVQVQLDDPAVNGTVEPFEVTIPAHRYAVVDISGDQRVPPGVAHWVVVRTPDGSDVVAERTLTGVGPNGVSYSIGLPVVATRWLVTVAATSDTATSQLSIVNPSATDAATVSVRRQGGGSVAEVAGATEVTVPPGERIVIDLLAAGFAADSTVEVDSDIAVVVGQWMAFTAAKDIATPLGVPVAGTQSALVAVVGPTVATDQSDTGGDVTSPPVPGPSVSESPAGADASSTTTTAVATTTTTKAATTTTKGA